MDEDEVYQKEKKEKKKYIHSSGIWKYIKF